jgi:phage baseplate assembly protein W
MTSFNQSDKIKFVQGLTGDIPFRYGSLGQPQASPKYYSDINSLFNLDGNPLLIYDEIAINRQISNVLGTPLGSEEFEPLFGSNLPYRIFDAITNTNAWLIRNDSIEALRRWMSGIIDINIGGSDVIPLGEESSEDGYYVYISYTIIRNRKTALYNVPFVR